jgi:hypothetical protein
MAADLFGLWGFARRNKRKEQNQDVPANRAFQAALRTNRGDTETTRQAWRTLGGETPVFNQTP